MNDETIRSTWAPATVYSLGFLLLISMFNYLDRSILGLALPLIKADMQLSDTALGLISGLAFVIFYTVLGVPIAWAADRWNRRNIVAAGFAFWSVMTALTGFVAGAWQLAMSRFLVGAGEACGIAPSTSMIADLFRSARRPLALAIFGTANSIAFIALYPIAGWIAQTYGWRAMFIAAGLPGVVLALLFLLTVKEPVRGANDDGRAARSKSESFPVVIRFLLGSRTYLYMLAGVAFMGANVFAAGAWTPTFLNRVHGMSIGEIAASIGPVRGFLGLAGVLIGGIVIDRIASRYLHWRIRIPAIACMLTGPAEALFLLGDTRFLWLTGFGLTSFLTLLHQGPIYAATVNVAPPRARAVATALLIFSSSLLGQAIGPAAVGIVTDMLKPEYGDEAIRYSMLIIAVTPVLAGLCFWASASHYARDLERASQA